MESTINKSYAKTKLANGEVSIAYNYIALSNIIILVFGAFIIAAISANIYPPLMFLSVPAWIAGYWVYIKSQRECIFIVPNVGLKFGKDQLPFNQISSIGVYQLNNSGYVYAESQGTRVKVTKKIKAATANAIDFEIRQLSGCKWS